ncbi:MAG TPA: FecR domain-containing protein [Myxococcaceae bacterium]
MRCVRAAERVVALGLLLVAALVGAAEPATQEEFVTVQPGDDCQVIAKRVWGAPERYKRLHELNGLKQGHPKVTPGMRLRIRPEPEAHLTYVKPDVNTRPPEVPQWQPGLQGQALYPLYQVNTLRGAGAEVTLKDTSKLQLRENALVVIYGAPQAAPKKEQPRKSSGVELVQGDLRMSLAALRGEPLPLETPAAQVAANGKDLFVSVDEKRMSRVAVFDGRAQVAAKGARVEVPGGQGTRVEEGNVPEAPRPLLPGPAWNGGSPQEVLLALEGAPPAHALKWQPVTGAVTYRAVLARDEAFNDVVAEVAPGSAALTLEASALPPGRYHARVQAVDALGLPGMPSATRAVQVVAVKVERGEVQNPGRVQGLGQVKLSVDPASGIALRVKGKAVGPQAVLLAPGAHTVDTAGGARALSVEVKPSVKADVTLRPEGGRYKLEVNARPTESGAPPIADGAVLVSGLEGSTVSNLVRKAETRWEADVTPARAGEQLRAVVEVRAYGEPVGSANAESEVR